MVSVYSMGSGSGTSFITESGDDLILNLATQGGKFWIKDLDDTEIAYFIDSVSLGRAMVFGSGSTQATINSSSGDHLFLGISAETYPKIKLDSGGDLDLWCDTSSEITFNTGATERLSISSNILGASQLVFDSDEIRPGNDVLKELGLVNRRWKQFFTGGIHLHREKTSAAKSTERYSGIIGVDSGTAARTVTLDTSDVVNGRIVYIKDEDGNANTNNITIATEGAETIDGAASITINTDYGYRILYSDGSNWFIIGSA